MVYQRTYIKKPKTNHVDICHPPMCTSHPVGKNKLLFPVHIISPVTFYCVNTPIYPRVNKEPGDIWSNILTSTRPEPAHYKNMFSIPDPNPPDISKTPPVGLCTLYIGLRANLILANITAFTNNPSSPRPRIYADIRRCNKRRHLCKIFRKIISQFNVSFQI